MPTLWAINPSRRRRKSGKRRHRRSAAQRAATRRMLAARFATNPAPKKRRSRRRSSARISRRSMRRAFARVSGSNAVALLKAGVISGAGAVAVDVAMGYAARVLPAAVATPLDASGQPQYGYYALKAGLAVLLGAYGGRFLPAGMAGRMAEGALTVMAYQFIRPLVPSGVALGVYANAPAATARPVARLSGVGRIGAYASLPNSGGAGSRAARVVNLANAGR